jgi:xylulokinase
MMSFLLGIDIGTSSVKCLLVDMMGNPIATSSQSYPVIRNRSDYAEQDAETWWEATCNSIKNILGQSGINPVDIKGVGLSGQMHGLVAIDHSGNTIRPAIIWMDARSKESIGEIHHIISKEKIGQQTLNRLAVGYLIVSLYWLKKNEPEEYKRIAKVLLPKDYIRYKLTGEIGTDWTDACGTLAFNPIRKQWAEDLLNSLTIDASIFPSFSAPYAIAGTIHAKAAKQCGLQRMTPVAFGGGDNAMQNMGNGLIHVDDLSSNIGTAAQVSIISDRPIRDPQLRMNTFCYAMDQLWTITGASLSGGGVLRWFENNVAGICNITQCEKQAEKIRPCPDGLLMLPYLSGERTPYSNPNARGIFFGLSHNHDQAHIIRAIMEGVVFSLRGSLEIMYQMGLSVKHVIASGGGARSRLWLQMQADIYNKEIIVAEVNEQACLGAAIMAAVGTGVYPDIVTACAEMVSYGKESISPITENVLLYDYYYQLFQDLYRVNRSLFDRLKIP